MVIPPLNLQTGWDCEEGPQQLEHSLKRAGELQNPSPSISQSVKVSGSSIRKKSYNK